ncbi:MAG: nucleotidyltransferase family protein [Acidobacteriia bacterium]|nr:nucleotidyltransferase family protein [Terriglobia bacterium]
MILAGGASSRMGSPKALLDWGGETVVDSLARKLLAHCTCVAVVVGHHAETIRSNMRRAGEVILVVNPCPELGQLSSLQCGLRALMDMDGVMFLPVDYPAVQMETVEKLKNEFLRQPQPALVIPRHDGRRGHPVVCGRDLIEDLLALPPEGQARDALRPHYAAARYCDVADVGIVRDVDAPGDYQELLKAAREQ